MARLTTTLLLSSSAAVLALSVLGALPGCGGSALSSSPSGADGVDAAADGNTQTTGSDGGNPADGASGTDAATDSGKKLLHVPAVHRAAAVTCSHDRAPGDFDTNIMSPQCSADADCTAGVDGRCLTTKVAARNNYCSYDTCFNDTDCTGKQVCTCRAAGTNDPNTCNPGNCKIDADCGVNGYCSPSADPDKTNFGTTGWWCHTAADACSDDTDCATTDGHPAKCVYDPTLSHWSCSDKAFLPP